MHLEKVPTVASCGKGSNCSYTSPQVTEWHLWPPHGYCELGLYKGGTPKDWQDTAASMAHSYHLLGLCLSLSLTPLNSGIHSSCLVPVNRFCCSSKFKTQKEINKDTHAHRAVWFASQQEQIDLLSTHYEGSARKYTNNKNHFSFVITKKQHLSLHTLQTTGKGNKCTITAPE